MKNLIKYFTENYGFSGVYKELKTTLFGVALSVVPLYFVYIQKASFSEIVPLLLLVVPFILHKSKSQKENENLNH